MKPRLSWKMLSTVLCDSPCSRERCSKAMGGLCASAEGAASNSRLKGRRKALGCISTSGAAPQQLAELPRGHRRREEEALDLLALHAVQQVELLLALDPLRHHPQAQVVGHGDHGRG